jgi:hypothetical protein
MGRFGLRQLCVFVLACGVYFGAIPHLYLLGLRGVDADDLGAFAFEAAFAWLLLAAVYVYWRQLTALAVHLLCVGLSLFILSYELDDIGATQQSAWFTLGRCIWAGMLISFPVSLVFLALSAVLGRRIDPLTKRFLAAFAHSCLWREAHRVVS